LSKMSCNDAFEMLHKNLIQVIDTHAPVKSIKVHRIQKVKEPWITSGISRCNNKQLKLYQRSIVLDATLLDVERYRNYRNYLRRIKRREQIKYHNNLCLEYKSDTRKL
ncbi:MAG: hypothetical protein MJE68_06500, partial [Proteobacteria bacterium]|nr:hypothetical protein [Pseudomonadota bacterium]